MAAIAHGHQKARAHFSVVFIECNWLVSEPKVEALFTRQMKSFYDDNYH